MFPLRIPVNSMMPLRDPKKNIPILSPGILEWELFKAFECYTVWGTVGLEFPLGDGRPVHAQYIYHTPGVDHQLHRWNQTFGCPSPCFGEAERSRSPVKVEKSQRIWGKKEIKMVEMYGHAVFLHFTFFLLKGGW